MLAAMLLVLTGSSGAQSCPKAGTKDTDWSKLAVQLCQDNVTDQLHLEAPSPDGKKLIYVNGPARTASLYLKFDRESTPQELYSTFGNPEVLWSPDSKAVAITTCSGGTGPCLAETFLVDDKGAQLDDNRPSPFEIVQETIAGHKGDVCYTEASAVALTWLDGSDKIVLIALPTAHCNAHNGGHIEAFVVSLSEGKVVARVNMQETIRRWHSIFGNGLRVTIPYARKNTRGTRK
jgi:hypothetical protein